MKVASVIDARSLTSPALKATEAAAAAFLSLSYLPLTAAFIVNDGAEWVVKMWRIFFGYFLGNELK